MKKLILLTLIAFSAMSIAEESPLNTETKLDVGTKLEKEKPSNIVIFLTVEGLIALNSYLASKHPKEFGAAFTLLSPVAGASPDASKTTNFVAIGGAMSMGLYNAIELKDDKYSESERFKRNMIAWHLWGASIYLTEKFTGQKKTVGYITPLGDNGIAFNISHRF